jgi:hypothetical protein
MKPMIYVITMLAVALVVIGCDSRSHYRRYRDGKSLYAILHNEIKPGDSIERVQELLGSGEPPSQPERILSAMKKLCLKHPDGCPDGVQENDIFIGYPIRDGGTLYLQFRDGRLVNHVAEDYTEYRPPMVIRK